jgi:hypothetical protein
MLKHPNVLFVNYSLHPGSYGLHVFLNRKFDQDIYYQYISFKTLGVLLFNDIIFVLYN